MSNLNLTTTRKYGLDWPRLANGSQLSDIQIDLTLAKLYKQEPYCHGNLDAPGTHMLRAATQLFPPNVWTVSRWTEEHIHGYCENEFLAVVGCASSSKSNDIAIWMLCDFLIESHDTVSLMASTSRLSLQDRCYEGVMRYFSVLKHNPHFYVPLKQSKTTMAIINDDEYDDVNETNTTTKASIRGVALQAGTFDAARGSLQGKHTKYVRLILEEFAAMKPTIAQAAWDSQVNLGIGSIDKRVFVLANPETETDLCGRVVAPLDGWKSVTPETLRWDCAHGPVIHRTASDSPAILEPQGAKKYPFLINAKHIEDVVRRDHGSRSGRLYYTMVLGFPAPVGSQLTVMSNRDVEVFNMTQQVVWGAGSEQNPPVWVWGLDPAFTSDGDNAVLQRALVGYFDSGVYGIAFMMPDYLVIDMAGQRPPVYQLVDQLGVILARDGIPVANGAVDSSGTQTVDSVIAIELGVTPIRCSFGSKSMETFNLSTGSQAPQSRFANQVTEMWYNTVALGRNRQIRQMPDAVVTQFCSRQFKKATVPLALESKKDYKARNPGSGSPDEGDALALCCKAAMVVAGLAPGKDRLSQGLVMPSGFTPGPRKQLLSSYTNNIDFSALRAYTGA